MSNLPEPVRRPPPPTLLRAAVSPTAAVATAAGAGIGLLAHSIVLTVVLAVVGWSSRMAFAVLARRRSARAARPHPAEVDPWSVPEPWRQLLQQAVDAQTRFDQAVARWPAGPTRDRLLELQPRVYEEVEQLAVVARHGAAAAGWTGATFGTARQSTETLSAELQRVQSERLRSGPAAPGRAAELARREEAIAAQLRAGFRARKVEGELHDRLRVAVARLDQTVAELLSLDGAPPSLPEPAGVLSALDELSDGITSLREALTETTGAPPDTETP